MNILVIGSGGREHAIVWKLRQSPNVQTIYCAPGNAGIQELAKLVSLKASDLEGLLRFVQDNEIDLTVVGPEQPLVQGIVDLFEEHGLGIFGPTKSASMLEGSKIFAKDFMTRHGIPTSKYHSFSASEIYDAERFVDELSTPLVIKADGLAAGKGVIVCQTKEEAHDALQEMMVQKAFGVSGERIVIEEYLEGEEASVFAITDGERFVTLAPAQDHKRILDGDAGKNTGGMGAYAPAPIITETLSEQIARDIIIPTLEGMRKEGTPYRGCLYCGLMITATGPRVMEFNCRFGDPEAQAVIPLLDGDFAQLLLSAANKRLQPELARQHPASAVCVVIASRGYPDDYETGKVIRGLEDLKDQQDVVVFHAGTRREGEKVLTSGGRVLGVTAIGYDHDLEGTIQSAYRAVGKIVFDGAYYRSDIGRKALQRLKTVG